MNYILNKNKEKLEENNLSFPGGFFPLGENNMWHGGIHLIDFIKEGSKDLSNTPITAIFDGKVIAYRTSKGYKAKKLLANISDKKYEDYKSKFTSTGFQIDFIYKRTEDQICYKLKDGLKDDEKKKLEEILDLKFSNDFVLIEHKTKTPKGNEIHFYSLYMHLKPYGLVNEEEKYRLFYFTKKYIVANEDVENGLVLEEEKTNKIADIIPPGAYVELAGDKIWGGQSTKTKSIVSEPYILVKSHYKRSYKTGYVNKKYLNVIIPKEKYYSKSNIKIYHEKSDEIIGVMKGDSQFEVIEDNNPLKKVLGQAKIIVKREQTADSGVEIQLSKDGYIDISSISLVNGIVYKINKDVVELDNSIKLYKDDLVVMTWNDMKKVDKKKYYKCKLIFGKEITGVIKVSQTEIKIEPIIYQVMEKPHFGNDNAELTKKGIRIRNDGNDKGEVIDIIPKGEQVYFDDENNFLKTPHGYHKISMDKYKKSGYILTATQGDLKKSDVYIPRNKEILLPIKIDYSISKDAKDGEIVTPKDVNASSNFIVGYASTYLEEKNILHLELFSDKTDFLQPKEDEKRDVYVIPKDTKGFKIKKMAVKKEVLDNPIEGGCLFKRLEPSKKEEANKKPFVSTMKVEVATGGKHLYWIKYDDKTKKIISYNEKEDKYKVLKDSEVTVYENEEAKNDIKTKVFKEEILVCAKTGNNPEYLQFTFHEPVKDAISGYINMDENQCKLISGNIFEISNPIDSWYKDNPELYDFSSPYKVGEDEFKTKEESVVESVTNDFLDTGKKEYCEILVEYNTTDEKGVTQFESNKVFISRDDLNNKKKNYYKWEDFFHKIDEKDKIYDMKDVIEDICKNKDFKGIIAGYGRDMIRKIITGRSDVRKYLYKLIIKHPPEWKTKSDSYYTELKDVPFKLHEDECEELKEHLKDLVFWDKVSGLPGTPVYFHPIEFMEHLGKLLDYNPYFGKKVGTNYNGPIVEVKSNPGFSPYLGNTEYDGYATVNGHLNELYRGVWNHEGTDFRGADGTPIHSLINATIIIVGWNKYYGSFLVANNNMQTDIYYLLAHLRSISVKQADIVYPKMTVATVGGSNKATDGIYSTGAHLHLSAIKTDIIKDFIVPSIDINIGTHNIFYKDGKNYINPLDYSIKWEKSK